MARISNSTGRRPGVSEGMGTTDTTRFPSVIISRWDDQNSPDISAGIWTFFFSALNDKSWLNELELIPLLRRSIKYGIWDEYRSRNNYEDAMRQSFQDAMMQIRQLVSNYYAHVQSLPSTPGSAVGWCRYKCSSNRSRYWRSNPIDWHTQHVCRPSFYLSRWPACFRFLFYHFRSWRIRWSLLQVLTGRYLQRSTCTF